MGRIETSAAIRCCFVGLQTAFQCISVAHRQHRTHWFWCCGRARDNLGQRNCTRRSRLAELISQLSVYAVMQLSLLYLVLPFIILTLTNRSKGAILKNLRLAAWVGAVSLGTQYLVARYLGAETPAIIGSLAAIVAIIIYAKLFAPKKKEEGKKTYTASQTLRAWAVYAFILLLILLSGPLFPPINAFLKSTLVSRIALPIHAPGTAFSFAWIGNAGLMLFLGTVLGGLVQGLSPRQLLVSLARTVVNLRKTTVTIISLVALAAIMNYAGMILVIADTLANITGKAYPLFAPLIGAIGTFWLQAATLRRTYSSPSCKLTWQRNSIMPTPIGLWPPTPQVQQAER